MINFIAEHTAEAIFVSLALAGAIYTIILERREKKKEAADRNERLWQKYKNVRITVRVWITLIDGQQLQFGKAFETIERYYGFFETGVYTSKAQADFYIKYRLPDIVEKGVTIEGCLYSPAAIQSVSHEVIREHIDKL
jgi:hypothetical protein